jgi:hypothetical protein
MWVGVEVAGKYKVERLLGEGGMGVVLFARLVELGHPVAIKCLKRVRGARRGTRTLRA